MRSCRSLTMVCALAVLLGGPLACGVGYAHDWGTIARPGLSAAARVASAAPVGVGLIR